MTRQRVVLDMLHDQFIMVGPGGIKMELSPGSRVLPIKRSATGHLMLPAGQWKKARTQAPTSAPLALPVL